MLPAPKQDAYMTLLKQVLVQSDVLPPEEPSKLELE